ncbi:YSIRK-targeted triacylglycerol lipase [Staphylococcus caprae]|uniref:YSIRK-targeted triacylglycerol lipase n=1 Tax=Staphylococcus caprae TaxID=29380 RepID=UPI003B2270B4
MENYKEKNRFSIRKYAVGAISIITGVAIFIGGHQAQAAEDTHQNVDKPTQTQELTQSVQKENQSTKASESSTEKTQVQSPNQQAQVTTKHNDEQMKEASNQNPNEADNPKQIDSKKEEPATHQDAVPSKKTDDATHQKEPSANHQSQEPPENEYSVQKNVSDNTESNKNNQDSQTQQATNSGKNTYSKEPEQSQDTTQQKANEQESQNDSKKKEKQVDKVEKQPSQDLQQSNKNDESKVDKPKKGEQTQTKSSNTNHNSLNQNKEKEKHQQTIQSTNNREEIPKPSKQTTKANKKSASQSLQSKQSNKLPKKAAQAQYKNQYPVIFVHGFVGLVGEDSFDLYPNYWGGKKYNVKEKLTEQGYRVHEANVGAFSSNYDRAVELYYYIKGGRVDYGAAHAAKYGHNRYGRTYKGIIPDWEPGKKVHLVGHSMGGQTIRLMEHFLRNGNQEEIDYQREYGGTLSDLFKGGKDNMISSITTLGTPHNGTPAADKLGTRKFVKNTINRIGRIGGSKALNLNLGFAQWGFKQKPNESYAEYAKRIANSKVWDTEDQAITDLTSPGAEKLNQMTTLNPNIVYTSYTGAATHTGPLGNEVPNVRQFFLFDLTSRVIGSDENKDRRVNDGIVPVTSSLHPTNQAFKKVGLMNPATDKGIWQVRPVQYNWDHLDFVGLDDTDYKRDGKELGEFYQSLINNMMRVEEKDGVAKK